MHPSLFVTLVLHLRGVEGEGSNIVLEEGESTTCWGVMFLAEEVVGVVACCNSEATGKEGKTLFSKAKG